MQLEPGQQVIWNYKPRQGYSDHKIPAQIIKLGAKRVQIKVQKTTGEFLHRWVYQNRLEIQ
ncbi:hypothetical protein WKK05_17565 [Nostoc sp. UHCC 0302]|jgi:hypothetical protein|uniref:hypothetical protein n=1 Tax=Nostoc sp. UHCC 0302 TaxID=3134896 RepID=UPI00311CC467